MYKKTALVRKYWATMYRKTAVVGTIQWMDGRAVQAK